MRHEQGVCGDHAREFHECDKIESYVSAAFFGLCIFLVEGLVGICYGQKPWSSHIPACIWFAVGGVRSRTFYSVVRKDINMKIALAQINTTVGDFDGNYDKIVGRIEWATKNGVDLVVFPEMAITGYPPKDLLEKTSFLLKTMEYLEKIAKKTTKDLAVIVGCITVNESTTGKGLFNSAAFLEGGKIRQIQNKTLLPTYDVFDEGRYFEPGTEQTVVEFKGRKFGLTICEDIWSSAEVSGRKLYSTDPVGVLVKKGAEFVINVSASPYVLKKRKLRETLMGNVARNHKVPVVYVNLVGGNDELIFDGSSMVFNSEGDVVASAGIFVEDSIIVDIDKLPEPAQTPRLMNSEEVYKALVLGLRDYIQKCGFKKVVLGLSGGIDSAIVAAIASDAIGAHNVTGIAMPTRFTSERSVKDAKKLAKSFGMNLEIINIENLFEGYLKMLDPFFKKMKSDATEENIQARIRGNILMAFSNKFGSMVLSTGNKSEMAIGYCTLYGDMSGGMAVISDVPKTMVYELANYVNRKQEMIPNSIIERAPSAELRHDQRDQDDLPPYDVLDAILKLYIEDKLAINAIAEMGFDKALVEDIVRRCDRNEYKRRQAPPGLKVTSKAFGIGRREPIACKC